MSRSSKPPIASDRKHPQVGGVGPRVIRPALFACAALFCALAAPALLPAHSQGLRRAPASSDPPRPAGSQNEIPEPKVRIEASATFINVCPGEEQRTRVTLAARGVGAECRPRYFWSVTGGRVEGGGPVVVWNLTGEPPGRSSYEATVTVETGAACGPRRRVSATWRVAAAGCTPRINSWGYTSRKKGQPAAGVCPNVALCCRATARPGQPDVPFSVELKGGTPGASPSFRWTIWGGQLAGGQGTEAVSVRAGEAERSLLARVEVGGYGTAAPCSATCVTKLVPVFSPLRVLVRDSKYGRPVKGAQVAVRGGDGERVFPTDEGGNFEGSDFAPRDYLVSVRAPGFERQEKRVTLDGPHGGSVVFSLAPTPGPTTPPTPPADEVAATPSPTPSPAVAEASPSPVPAATPPPVEFECTGCCLFDLERRECQRLAALAALALGLGALGAGAAFSLWGLDGGLATVLSDEEVHCTVFAPFEAPPGDCFIVQAFAHLPGEDAALLASRADDNDPDAKQRGTKKLGASVERGKRLSFALQMPGLEVDVPAQSLVWWGMVDAVTFNVTIPADFKPRNLIGVVTVAYESVPVGQVSFKFKVAAANAPQPVNAEAAPASAQLPVQVPAQVPAPTPAPTPAPAPAPCPPQATRESPEQSFVRYKRAFISYASEDRAEVLKRVQMLKTLNVEFFQDLLTLEPGDRWERMLYKYIDESEVIYLFWSNAAKRSEWVEREVQYALKRRSAGGGALPAIVPIIIEGPPIVAPPKHLADLHFNDKILYFIEEEESKLLARLRRFFLALVPSFLRRRG